MKTQNIRKTTGRGRSAGSKTTILAAAAASVSMAALAASSASAADIVWSGGTGTGTAWLTTTNWTGSVVPTVNDIAEFAGAGTGTPIGVNMNTAASGGPNTQMVGEVLVSGTTTRVITNSAGTATGTLSLRGVGSTFLANTSASSGLTIFTTGPTMRVALDAANGDVNVANAAASITVNAAMVAGTSTAIASINKTGAGLLTLSGQNVFADGSGNSINVNGGTLNVANTAGTGVSGNVILNNAGSTLRSGVNATSSIAGSVTANTGTVLEPGGSGTLGTLTLGSLNANGSTTFNFDLSGSGQDLMNSTGAVALAGTETVNVSGSGFAPNVDYTLMNYGSVSGGAFTLGSTPANGFAYSLLNNANTLVLHVTASANNLVWTGAGGTNWDVNNTVNWTGSVSGKFQDGDFVTFDDTASGTTAITIAGGGVKPASITFNNDTKDYSFTGGSINDSVSGPTNVIKNGTGSVTLSNTNNFTGSIQLNAGTLAISSGAAIGGTSGVTIGNGATLKATGTVSTNRAITIGSGGGVIDTNGNNMTITTAISGAAPLAKNGLGNLTLSAPAIGMSGAVAINGGKIILNATDTNGTGGTGQGRVAVNNGGTLEVRNVNLGFTNVGGTGIAFLLDVNNGGTVLATNGASQLQGSGSFNMGTTGLIKMQTGVLTDSLLFNNSIRHAAGGNQNVSTTISVEGPGLVRLASGGTSESTAGTQYAGAWALNMDNTTGVLSLGPILNGGFGEPLNALGYKAPLVTSTAGEGYSGSTNPITINSGTLAFGADFRQHRPTTSLALLADSFRSPLTLAGGKIASTGREYDDSQNFDPVSATPVTANIHANIIMAPGTTSTVLLYDPVPSNNPGNVGGGRSLNITTDAGAVEHDGLNTPVPNNITWGAGSTLAVDSGAFPGVGALNFTRAAATSAMVSVGAGATLLINAGATVNLGGTQDSLSDGTNQVNVTNNSTTSFNIIAGDKNVGAVAGVGVTTVNSGTSLTATSIRQSTLNANGNVTIRPNGTNGGAGGVSNINNLNLAGGVRLDIGNNKLVTKNAVGSATGGTYNGVSGQIQSGRNGGGWGGNGIVTTQTDATTSNFTSIGVATAAEAKGISASATAVWAGQTVTGSDTLVMYTYGGDANLDGKINVDDYGKIDFNVNLGTAGWSNGDFNYDGKINVDDYGIIDFNVGIQGAPFFTAGGAQSASALSGVSAVPEPATLSVLGIAAMGFAARRRRSK